MIRVINIGALEGIGPQTIDLREDYRREPCTEKTLNKKGTRLYNLCLAAVYGN
jgi:hypothetical protein